MSFDSSPDSSQQDGLPKYQKIGLAIVRQYELNDSYLAKTQLELAEEYGVNRHTVRHALDWLERTKRVGRITSRSCAPGDSVSTPPREVAALPKIGYPMWINSLAEIDLSRIESRMTVLRGAQMELASQGYYLDIQCLGPSHRLDRDKAQRLCREWEGIILEPMQGDSEIRADHPFYSMLDRAAFFGTLQGVHHNSVCPDFYAAGQLAVDELVRLGARRILYGGPSASTISHMFLRLAAAETAASRHPGVELICSEGGFFADEAFSTTKRFFLEGGRCDAILAVSSYSVMGTLRALADLGVRVPDDVQVIGISPTNISPYMVPRPTMIASTDSYHLGREVARMAVTLLQDDGVRQPNRLVPMQLAKGETTRHGVCAPPAPQPSYQSEYSRG